MNKDEWKQKMGINYINRPNEDVLEKAITCDGRTLHQIDSGELDEIIVALSNYYLFLQSQLGQIEARINFLTQKMDSELGKSTSKMAGGHFTERKALALATNDSIGKISERLTEEKARHDMLVPLCRGIFSKIDIVKKIYERRYREAKQ